MINNFKEINADFEVAHPRVSAQRKKKGDFFDLAA